LDKEVWEEFCKDQERLHATAAAIRRAAGEPSLATMDDALDDLKAPEGRLLLRMHRLRERSPAIVRERRQRALKQHGVLRCEVCGFDFKAVYGAFGDGFIECHHTVPLSNLEPGQRTKLSDLALLCANCHRIIHRASPMKTVAELRAIFGGDSPPVSGSRDEVGSFGAAPFGVPLGD
jgi:5-methylcytosine-specific restriction protein A